MLVAVMVLSRVGNADSPSPAAKDILAVLSMLVPAAISLLILQEKVKVAVSSPEPASPKPPPEAKVSSKTRPVEKSPE